MWILVLSIVLQALLVVHCIKTGRNTIWIWVIVLLSYAGILAYVAVEVLPEVFGSRTAKRTTRTLGKVLDPKADLRRYESEAKVTGNVASQQRYAEELVRQGRYDDAIASYRSVLTGLYENDPNLMLGLARAQFGKQDFSGARTTLDHLIRLNPEFKSAEGHLLYARSLEASGDIEKALEEYAVLAPYYPGAEASYRYAQLLKAQGRDGEAVKIVEDLLDQARIAPAHYRRAQKTWLDMAERILGR